MIIQPGTKNAADYVRNVPPEVLVDRGIKVAAMYAKYWESAYVKTLHAAGVGVVAICEGREQDALLGVSQARINTTRALTALLRAGYPEGETIIHCHDTSAYNTLVPGYFLEAEELTRNAGYRMGGYIAKDPANACIRAGVTFDLIWAPAAYSWGGGRHPDAHVWQRPSGNLVGTVWNVDLGDVKRPFRAWGRAVPKPLEPPRPPIVAPPPPIAWHLPNIPTTTPNLEGTMKNAIIPVQSDPAIFLGIVNERGAALRVEWSGPGENPRTAERIQAHIAQGAVTLPPVDKTGLLNCVLDGPVPPGWTAQDFFRVDV